MAAVAHLALADALARSGLDTIPGSRTDSPAPRIALSSPFDPNTLSPASSRAESPSPSLAPSFHTARSGTSLSFRRPTPITIPTATIDEPLFSAYPISPGLNDDKQDPLGNSPVTSLASTLIWPPSGRPVSSEEGPRPWEKYTSNDNSTATGSRAAPRGSSSVNVSRRRSTTALGLGLAKRAQDASSKFDKALLKAPSPRRRASFNTEDTDNDRWREFGTVPRLEDSVVFDFDHSLEAVNMVPSARPTSSGLRPPPRPSSLLPSKEALLRLAALSIAANRPNEKDQVAHFGDENTDTVAADAVSFLSEELTSSPSTMTKSLPSTKTSLSRSARSGKEGEECTDCMVQPRNDTERVRLERRRMILLEIIETEISYVHDLQALVHIYLPQLAALPHVSERVHTLVMRNTTDLLQFHVQFAAHMVDIIRFCGMSYEEASPVTIDRVTKRVADLFVREVTSFSLYNDYCAGSTAASALIRNISHRADYEAFEKRCQIITSTGANPCLRDLLYNRPPKPSKSRLRFQDILISPVQRVCRYPLLLGALLADVNRELPLNEVATAVENAETVMRAVASHADDSRQWKEAELKTIAVADRMEPTSAINDPLLERLGVCRLIGTLDVLHHHPQFAPLDATAKVKYMAAFLYRGYLILSKVKRGNRFEPKHYLPLEAFELIDITEGFLPHSIRLTLRNHNFDLAASCDAEKEVWANELIAAKNESTVPPFELPSSVSLFAPPSRQMTANGEVLPKTATARKRQTLSALELSQLMASSPEPNASPPASEYRRSQSSTLLLRRASAGERVQTDRALADVIFENLATARSKAQLQYTTTVPDSRRTSSIFDTPKIRRRLSMADTRAPGDLVSSPEVRGAIMQARPRPRTMIFTDSGCGDVGISRNASFSSMSDVPLRARQSSVSLRRGLEITQVLPERRHRRQSASFSSINFENRMGARSVPASPAMSNVAQFEMATEPVEVIDSPPAKHMRMRSDDSFVFVPDLASTRLPTIPSPTNKESPSKTSGSGTIRRSMSFFGRRTPSLSDLTTDVKSRSLSQPGTPDRSPQTPKRRRSLRLFGQLRGFTPI